MNDKIKATYGQRAGLCLDVPHEATRKIVSGEFTIQLLQDIRRAAQDAVLYGSTTSAEEAVKEMGCG